MLVMLGILIPTATSADLQSSVSGISPTLDPNEEYSVEINVTTNSLLIWFWDAQGYGSIEFWIETPNGTIAGPSLISLRPPKEANGIMVCIPKMLVNMDSSGRIVIQFTQ